ncbi:hypothetical protein KQI42_16950 [Tissierella sp. MSJ-40]|uniref:CRISPR-associated protein Csh1 n=1 Tax=Tissierella simiarum TaxID=2841534 RepID=A0ABS6EA28_9FIRM|nr:hypothetical protein [Tissierella simiarum]MBU5439706.1 hypothetical protein [Tissierella simiarum]
MIGDLLAIFKSAYEKHGDKIVLDNYILKDGIYIRINEDKTKDILKIKAIKNKDKTIDYISIEDRNEFTTELFNWFKIRDYYSSLVDMNKAIDKKKKIHSNNYLAIFIKKENLVGSEALSKVELMARLEEYYDILEKPEIKYKDKRGKDLLNTVKPDVDNLDLKIKRDFIMNNLDDIIDEIEAKKDEFDGYVKIFFADKEDFKKYKLEYTRYLLPNIFNKNDYNVLLNNEIVGLSNNNMGMNSKKTYLEHKTTKFKVPYRITSTDAMILKKFFDWLNFQPQGSIYIPTDFKFNKSISDFKDNEVEDCHYLYISKGKEVVIEDYEFLPRFKKTIDFTLENFLQIEEGEKENRQISPNKKINKLWELESEVDEVFFNKRLKNGYFMDPKIKDDFSKNMLNILILSRQALYCYFKKGSSLQLISIIDRISLDLIKDHLRRDYNLKAAKAYNLRLSLLEYFQLEGRFMGGRIKNIIETLKIKINSDDIKDLDTDEEFYFLSGQLAYFLLSKSRANKKTHDLLEGFLKAKNASEVKKQLRYSYDRYKHAIPLDYKRFNKSLSMVLGYDVESNKKYEDVFLAGFLAKNIFYTSNKEKGDMEDEEKK